MDKSDMSPEKRRNLAELDRMEREQAEVNEAKMRANLLRLFDMNGVVEPVAVELEKLIDRVLRLLPVEVVQAIPNDEIGWDYKADRNTAEFDVWLSIGNYDYRLVGSDDVLYDDLLYAYREVAGRTERARVYDDMSLEWELLPPSNVEDN